MSESQSLVVSLRGQIDRLAATAQEQTAYIATLRAERDRLNASLSAATESNNLRLSEAQTDVAALKAQLDRLAAVSREQAGYISILESERDRLERECTDAKSVAQHLAATTQEQLAYIKSLETRCEPGANPPKSVGE